MGYLTDKLNEMNDKISKKKKKIKKIEDDYETLIAFRKIVGSSESDFSIANKNKKNVLSELNSIKNKSVAATNYQKGMNVSLDGIGMDIVGASFWGLDKMIGLKLTAYLAEVKIIEGEISVLNIRKEELKAKIAIGEAIV